MRFLNYLAIASLLLVTTLAMAQEERGPGRQGGGGFATRELPENAKPLFGDKLQDAIFPENAWEINADGELIPHVDGCIWTKEKYKNYMVEVEYKLGAGANSGFLIQCSDMKNWIPNTIEIQLLDDAGKEPNYHSCGAIYGYQGPSKNTTLPAGEWNKMRIIVRGDYIMVVQNGEMINRINAAEWTDRLKSPAGTDIEKKFQGKALAEAERVGHIGLQGLHGKSGIIFRNAKIAALPDELPARTGTRGQRPPQN